MRLQKQVLAWLLAVCLLAGLLPLGAAADGEITRTNQNVATEEALIAAFSGPDGAGDVQATLTEDITLSGVIKTLGAIVVPQGVTLELDEGAYLQAEIHIFGRVTMRTGTRLETTMGGDITIADGGELETEKGSVLASVMGGRLNVQNGGRLVLFGLFACGSYYDGEQDAVNMWFQNNGNVTGDGVAVARSVFFSGSLSRTVTLTGMLENELDAADIFVITEANSSADWQTLNDTDAVRGVILMPDPEFEGEGTYMIPLEQDLTVQKPTCVWGTDLVLGHGHTLTVPDGNLLSFNRTGRVVAEAKGVPEPDSLGGGTLVIEGKKLLSGTDEDACVTVTGDIAWLSAASYWPDDRYPATAEWLYVLNAATARGDLTDTGLTLTVDDQASMTLDGDLSADQLDLRGRLDPGGHTLTTSGALFDTFDEAPCELTGTGTLRVTDTALVGCPVDIPAGVTLQLDRLYGDGEQAPGVRFYGWSSLVVPADGGVLQVGDTTLFSGNSATPALIVPVNRPDQTSEEPGADSAVILSAGAWHAFNESWEAWPADWIYLIDGSTAECYGGDIADWGYESFNNGIVEEGGKLGLVIGYGATLILKNDLKLDGMENRGRILSEGDAAVTADYVFTLGDVNSDGSINAADALMALQHSVRLIELEGAQGIAANVNNDEAINASDALLILQYSVKLIDRFF